MSKIMSKDEILNLLLSGKENQLSDNEPKKNQIVDLDSTEFVSYCDYCNRSFKGNGKFLHEWQCEKNPNPKSEMPCKYCGTVMPIRNLGIHVQSCSENKGKQEFANCKYCNGEYRHKGLAAHENLCYLNPHQHISTAKCHKCGIDIARRGLQTHIAACTGNPKETVQRLKADKTYRELKQAKHAAKNLGISVVENNDVTENGAEVKQISSSVDQHELPVSFPKTIDNLRDMMVQHLGAISAEQIDMFMEWLDLSTKLWNSK